MELTPTLPDHDGLQPGRLWSLLDMINHWGHLFYLAGRDNGDINQSIVDLSSYLSPDTPIPDSAIEVLVADFNKRFPDWESRKASLGKVMPLVTAQMERFVSGLKARPTAKELEYAVRSWDERYEDTLKSEWFYWVPPGMAQYYLRPQPFGSKVNDRFPQAIDDIEDAGKCLALGQGTATVLHLMRVMEVGLKALAAISELGISYAPSWEAYLNQISKKIGDPHRQKTPEWIKLEPLMRDVSGDLLTVKQAFRNPTMHVDRKYGPEEAEEIYKAVRRFMERLAVELPS
jgi:hypothetical protein